MFDAVECYIKPFLIHSGRTDKPNVVQLNIMLIKKHNTDHQLKVVKTKVAQIQRPNECYHLTVYILKTFFCFQRKLLVSEMSMRNICFIILVRNEFIPEIMMSLSEQNLSIVHVKSALTNIISVILVCLH